eukprot:3887170-Rhodomonas_salina.1
MCVVSVGAARSAKVSPSLSGSASLCPVSSPFLRREDGDWSNEFRTSIEDISAGMTPCTLRLENVCEGSLFAATTGSSGLPGRFSFTGMASVLSTSVAAFIVLEVNDSKKKTITESRAFDRSRVPRKQV